MKVADQCNADYLNDCIYRQLIYRASFALVILYTLNTIFSLSDFFNRNFQIIKFFFAIGLFIAFWWADQSLFVGWAEVARVFSFLWLIIQSLIFLDLAFDAHELVMSNISDSDEDNNRPVYAIYIFMSLVFLAAAIIGLVYLFKDYTGCGLGLFFTILTLIMGVLGTIVSLLDVVNKGMLTPLMMFAYSVFMCWYALLSNPETTCNPTAGSNDSSAKTTGVVIICIVTLIVGLYIVANGSTILNVFNPNVSGKFSS